MRTPMFTALALAVAAITAGCAQHTSITGDGTRHEQVIHGSVGITGEDHELTILAGSDVTKLSIIGEENRVFIQDGALVWKIELAGEDNEVSCPPDLAVEFSTVGEDNRLKRRP